ncbi:Uncharacterised protein [Vibrio cholerae]|nr:Uncharacterised protein [Vibrio cholerae]
MHWHQKHRSDSPYLEIVYYLVLSRTLHLTLIHLEVSKVQTGQVGKWNRLRQWKRKTAVHFDCKILQTLA